MRRSGLSGGRACCPSRRSWRIRVIGSRHVQLGSIGTCRTSLTCRARHGPSTCAQCARGEHRVCAVPPACVRAILRERWYASRRAHTLHLGQWRSVRPQCRDGRDGDREWCLSERATTPRFVHAQCSEGSSGITRSSSPSRSPTWAYVSTRFRRYLPHACCHCPEQLSVPRHLPHDPPCLCGTYAAAAHRYRRSSARLRLRRLHQPQRHTRGPRCTRWPTATFRSS